MINMCSLRSVWKKHSLITTTPQ